MEIVCQHCENIQEKIDLKRNYLFKIENGINYIKYKGKDWEKEPLNICTKCGNEIEIKVNYSGIRFGNCEKNDPNHANFWKKGKTDSEVASVIAGETDPY